MTASVSIVGALRTIRDAPSAPSPDSGVPTHANFQSVLDQYRASRESDSNSSDNQGAPQQKQKDSDPNSTLAVPQPETPAVETPRLILPFTTSIALRQNATASADDAAAQDSTAAAEPTGEPSAIANTVPTPANLRSTLDLRSLKSANSGAQPKTQAKLQDSTPSQTVAAPLGQTAPAESSSPALPAAATASDQAGVAVQNRSTVGETPAPDIVSTSTLDRGIAYQYRPSRERPAETAVINRASREPQPEAQKVSDPTQAVAAPVSVPVPVPNTLEPQPPLHSPTGSNTPRQDAPAVQTNAAVTQDSSAASGSDPKNAMPPPALERAEDTVAAPPQGSLAFAARLTPTEDMPAPAPEASPAADPQTRTSPLQAATPATPKQIATGADLSADAHNSDGGGQSDKDKTNDRFAKPDTLLPQMQVAVADQTLAQATSPAPTSTLSPAARMDQVQDPPAPASSGNHDITIRIPDANTDQGTAVRFVERAGEVHVSVRTGDVEMAQTLRGGLNDLVGRLEDGGIRTQVWQPGAEASTSQNDSHQPFADPDGSNGRQHQSGSNSEQESKQQNRPRWVEELEGSIGNQTPKETPQLLWQA